MENQLSRRTALLAIGGTVGIAAVPVAAIAGSATVDRTAWDRAFAKTEKAKALSDHEDARHEPIWQAYKAATEAVPHVTLRADPHSGRLKPVTTADWRFVRECRKLVKDVNEGRCWLETVAYPSLKEHYILAQEVAAAADARDAEIERIDERLGYSPSCDRQEAACEAWLDAEAVLFDLPAPDGPTLLWKLEATWLGDEEAGYCKDRVSGILADARRLLASGRA